MIYEYSYFYNKGDHDDRSLPGPFDIEGGLETFEDAVVEVEDQVSRFNLGRPKHTQVVGSDYTIVKRPVAEWEIAG